VATWLSLGTGLISTFYMVLALRVAASSPTPVGLAAAAGLAVVATRWGYASMAFSITGQVADCIGYRGDKICQQGAVRTALFTGAGLVLSGWSGVIFGILSASTILRDPRG
jgi:hypothetical protein